MAMHPQADGILEWLEQEMAYRSTPSAEAIAKICRGNMLPVWKFLLERVKSEKNVEKMRRNLHVHGSSLVGSSLMTRADKGKGRSNAAGENKLERNIIAGDDSNSIKVTDRMRRKQVDAKLTKSSGVSLKGGKGKEGRENEESNNEMTASRERALVERDAAEKELSILRLALERLTKDMKGRMKDLSKEEGERRRVLDEKSDSRYKQVLLEAYDQRCEQCIRILSEYWRRLHCYVEQARESQREKSGWSAASHENVRSRRGPDLYASAVKSTNLGDDQIVIETAEERITRMTCEIISGNLIDNIRSVCSAYDGDIPKTDSQLREARLGIDVDVGDVVPDQVRDMALRLLKSPRQLLQATINYSSRAVSVIARETEHIDLRADAEHLRYRFENNRVTEDVAFAKEKGGFGQTHEERNNSSSESTSNGLSEQLRERQTAHVQQFMATEEMLNFAEESKRQIEELLARMHGVPNDTDASLTRNDQLRTEGGSRQVQLELWAKERELSGLKASVGMLLSEVQRLKVLAEERKQAREDLREKWRKIEEFNARRMELESVYTALIHANMAAASSWEQQAFAAREHSSNTILPVCVMLQNRVTDASDLIEREVTAFQRTPDNRLYLFPAFPPGLLDATGTGNGGGPDAVAAAQRNADLLTARAGAGDPSAISSINRISVALHNSTVEGTDAGLVAVIESLQHLFKHKVSGANLLHDLTKTANQMQVLRDLVYSGRTLLISANSTRPEYERTAEACVETGAEQENTELGQWLPELKAAIQEAQKCLDNSKHVLLLVDEWWEQPASTSVDWISVDGQNVAAWLAHVKQLQATFYEKQLL